MVVTKRICARCYKALHPALFPSERDYVCKACLRSFVPEGVIVPSDKRYCMLCQELVDRDSYAAVYGACHACLRAADHKFAAENRARSKDRNPYTGGGELDCLGCGETLSVMRFDRDDSTESGLRYYCRDCERRSSFPGGEMLSRSCCPGCGRGLEIDEVLWCFRSSAGRVRGQRTCPECDGRAVRKPRELFPDGFPAGTRFLVSWECAMDCDWALDWPWWQTGYTLSDDQTVIERMTVTAAIIAEDEDAAKNEVAKAYGFDDHRDNHGESLFDWNFCDTRPDDWSPFDEPDLARQEWMCWPDADQRR